MMKKKQICITVILCLCIMTCWLTGCHGGEPSYDDRLIAADSLLRDNDPDSALQLLSGIDGSGLANSGDRAYHALLSTQASYRCYAEITSDSTIDVALDYYRSHPEEQEKLTRAYIYKGAVSEVLGDPETAMTYYKLARSNAAISDHFNLGYANLRIGYLYRDFLVADSANITHLKAALHHFEQVPDSFYVVICTSTIGNCYWAINNSDSASAYLEQADTLAKKLQLRALEQTNLVYLADMKMYGPDLHNIEQAKDIALSLLSSKDCPDDEREQLLLTAAFTLAQLNKVDSAKLFLKQVDKSHLNDGLRVFYHRCHAELARCSGDFDQFKYHFKQADEIADSLVTNDMQRQLRDVEAKYDNETLRYEALKYKTNWQLLLLGSLLALSLLAIALLAIARKAAQRKRQISDNQDMIERLRNDAARLSSQLAANREMSDSLKTTIRHQIDTFTHLVEIHYTQFTSHPEKFSTLFQKTYNANQPDTSFWSNIRTYADSTCNGIITRTLENHPSLNESDVRFLSLCCCDLPTMVVMVCMGYNDVHSVYNKKRRITAKLGPGVKLDDYILQFK